MWQLQRDLAQDCVQFLHAIHRYLRASGTTSCNGGTVFTVRSVDGDECDDTLQQEDVGQTYLNVIDDSPHVDVRTLLMAQCEKLLIQFGKDVERTEEHTERLFEVDDEENSYLDMSGSKILKPNGNSSHTTNDTEPVDEVLPEPFPNDGEPMNDALGENSYDLTTDQILYDECQQDFSYDEEPIAVGTPPLEFTVDDSQCPYGGLPASHLRLQQSPKHGTLFKQEKRLFFDQFKKYYVGLIGKWLLLYNSHNDLKPFQMISIKSIRLDLSLNEQINEKHLFQIITQTESKVHFLSPSFRDLNEWIVAIENNLIERNDRSDDGTAAQMVRKLPLPPYPARGNEDETDLHRANHVEDGIYEEPTVCLKVESKTKSKTLTHGYDIPKPCAAVPSPLDSVPSITKNNSDSSLNCKKFESLVKSPDTIAVGLSTPISTPKKSWLKNRFNRSPPDSIEGKVSKKSLKKLSFEELSTPEVSVEPISPTKSLPASNCSKFTLNTTPSSKGTKINMIISQLEANGQLNLLSKRLNETNKRYTWVGDGISGAAGQFG